MTTHKTNAQLKREYYGAQEYFTPRMIADIIRDYGDKPATSGEAFYVAHYYMMALWHDVLRELSKGLTNLQECIATTRETGLVGFRTIYRSPIHTHTWTLRPFMRLEQCIVCDALREAEEGKYIWL